MATQEEVQEEIRQRQAERKLASVEERGAESDPDLRSKLSLSDLVTGGVPEEEAGRLTQFFEKGGVPGLLERTFPSAFPKGKLTAEQPPSPPINPDLQARIALEAGAGIVTGGVVPAVRAVVGAGRLLRTGAALVRPTAVGGAEATASLAGETFDPSKNPLRRAAITGTVGAVAEGVFPLGVAAVNRLRRGGTELVEGGRQAVEETGGLISAAAVSENSAVDIIEGMARASIFGGGRMRAFIRKSSDSAKQAVDAFVERFAPIASREGVEDLVTKTGLDRGDAFREVARQRYSQVDGLGDVTIDLDPIIKEAERLAKRGLSDPKLNSIVSRLRKKTTPGRSVDTGIDDASGNRIVRQVPGNSRVTFAEGAEIRSDLLGIGRGGTELIGGKATGAGKRLGGQLDNLMARAGKNLALEAHAAWRRANDFWKEGKTLFNSRLMKQLTKTDPASVFNIAIRNKGTREIEKLRKVIFDPRFVSEADDLTPKEIWQEIQGQWLLDLMDRATRSSEGGELLGKSLVGALNKFSRTSGGDNTLRALFPDANDASNLRQAARNLELTQAGVGKDVPGRIAIQLTQIGAAGQVLSGFGGATITAGSVAILAGPAAAARLLTKTGFVKWVTIGNNAVPFSDRWVRAVGQIMAISLAEGAQVEGTSASQAAPVPSLSELIQKDQQQAPLLTQQQP